MYLIDTNVISEARKETRANPGVVDFFREATSSVTPLYLSVITLGELRRGIELLRHRGDADQAARLESWLKIVAEQYGQNILPFDNVAAQIWGRLRVSALVNDLTIVTRNVADFRDTGAKLMSPFR